MPSIYYCHFLGDGWSEWKKSTILDELPEEFATDGVAILLTSRDGDETCYLYDPEKGMLTSSCWIGDEWGLWKPSIPLSPPANFSALHEDTNFTILSHEDGDWLISINLSEGSVYGAPIDFDTQEVEWDGPFSIEAAPNMDESTDVFGANDDDAEWVIAVNLEEQSVFFAEWDGDDYSSWEAVSSLDLPDIWLELGIDLDGAIVEGQLQVYVIVYDDDFDDDGLGHAA